MQSDSLAAQSQSNTLGSNTANALSQLGIGGASALGAGQIGAANAMAGGFSNLGNSATLASLLRGNTNTVAGLQNQYGVGNFYGPGINNPVPTSVTNFDLG